jgi:hypothetical protein
MQLIYKGTIESTFLRMCGGVSVKYVKDYGEYDKSSQKQSKK